MTEEPSGVSSPLNVLYIYEERIPEHLRQLIRSSIPPGDFVVDETTYAAPVTEVGEKMGGADIALLAPGRVLAEPILAAAAARIRLIQLLSCGYDKFNTADARRYGIPVANNGGANAVAVAEHTLLLMLAVYKQLPDSHRRTVEGSWAGNSHGMDMFMLHNKTLGLAGFGAIGKEVARRASAFGMRVLYYDPVRASPEVERELTAEYTTFDQLLSKADVLSLHVHLNDATARMIGRRELERMRPSAVVINVSRAELVDNRSLLTALQSGHLWGVGLDVYEHEPTQPNDPLLLHPHVVATPHMAGSTVDTYVVALKNAVTNFYRVKSGAVPLWVVNGVPAAAGFRT